MLEMLQLKVAGQKMEFSFCRKITILFSNQQ